MEAGPKAEAEFWSAIKVMARRRPRLCSHGWNLACPCYECRAEFDDGIWDAPGVEALAELAKSPHKLAPHPWVMERWSEYYVERMGNLRDTPLDLSDD